MCNMADFPQRKISEFTLLTHVKLAIISSVIIFCLLQRRRGSKDAAGDEKSEWERRLDKPSVPLKAIGDPGPPKIVEIQEKYGAVEDQTACCYMFVEGNPAPTFKFYKVTSLIKDERENDFPLYIPLLNILIFQGLYI